MSRLGSILERSTAELVKLGVALVVVGVLVVVALNLLVDGAPEPFDRARLAETDEAVTAAQGLVADVPTPAGLDDQGTDLERGCRAEGSSLVPPSVTRTWTAPEGTDLAAAGDEVATALAADGWTEPQGKDPVVVHRQVAGVPLVAEVGLDDDGDLRVHVHVDGPDGCLG